MLPWGLGVGARPDGLRSLGRVRGNGRSGRGGRIELDAHGELRLLRLTIPHHVVLLRRKELVDLTFGHTLGEKVGEVGERNLDGLLRSGHDSGHLGILADRDQLVVCTLTSAAPLRDELRHALTRTGEELVAFRLTVLLDRVQGATKDKLHLLATALRDRLGKLRLTSPGHVCEQRTSRVDHRGESFRRKNGRGMVVV